ncbi:MAG TPA: hypothetical protein VGF55_06935 [Gemmataceae bacterium]|jgi:hypothetical protein
MTEEQALAEAERRWGKEFPDRVFCCTEPTFMAGVIECPGDTHQGFCFTGGTWEEVFEAHDRVRRSTLWWKVRAVDRAGQPVVRVVDHTELVSLDWDDARDWTIRVKRTPKRKRRGETDPSPPMDEAPTEEFGSGPTTLADRPGPGHSPT